MGLTKAGRPRRNDANYCRLKGWAAGTVLTLDQSDRLVFHHGITDRPWHQRIRITAVGEDSILVRLIYDQYESGEQRWVRQLCNSLVVAGVAAKGADRG
jgi:hypothetical protein